MKNLLSNPNYDFKEALHSRSLAEEKYNLRLAAKDIKKEIVISIKLSLARAYLTSLKIKSCISQIDNEFITILEKFLNVLVDVSRLKCEVESIDLQEKYFHVIENVCAIYMFSKIHPDENFTKKLLSVLPTDKGFFYECCLLSEEINVRSVPPIEDTTYKELEVLVEENSINSFDYIVRFIQRWPKLVSAGKITGLNKIHHTDEKFTWSGYWSFSAAWAAYVFNLDDSAIVDNEFYPSALVQLARSTHPVDPSRKLNAHIAEVSTELPVFDIDKSLKINLLKRYKNLLDVIYKDLPSNAKDKVLTSAEKLAVEALAEHESVDTIEYLNDVFCFLHQAEFDLEFLTQYKISYTILVDWKDSDTAVDLTSAASKSHGLNTEFEFDDSDCENYSVEDVLNQFDQWLVPHGKRLVQHDTESDFFVAFVIDNVDLDMVNKELDNLSAP